MFWVRQKLILANSIVNSAPVPSSAWVKMKSPTDNIEVESLADLGIGGDLALQPARVPRAAVLQPQRVVTRPRAMTTLKYYINKRRHSEASLNCISSSNTSKTTFKIIK